MTMVEPRTVFGAALGRHARSCIGRHALATLVPHALRTAAAGVILMRALLGMLATAAVLLTAATSIAQASPYAWHGGPVGAADTLAARIPPPEGFRRIAVAPGSFGEWLRGLPMKPQGVAVMLYDGRQKAYQGAHYAVIDIDTGTRDLQQCADAIMRLRAEYLFAAGRHGEIGFNYTNGVRVDFARWARGERPRESKSKVTWSRSGKPDASHAALRRYLDNIFSYAGTYSLSRELKPVAVADMQIGDVFVIGGFPGHAVLVIDMAENVATGEKRFLLMQSYMPAQDMHVLNNPESADGSPWYPLEFGALLTTPEWRFGADDLKRWP